MRGKWIIRPLLPEQLVKRTPMEQLRGGCGRPRPRYCRVSTDDLTGRIKAYVGEGEITDEALDTFGGYGVMEVPQMQELLRYICENGFEHHVAICPGEVGDIINEAFNKYLNWQIYYHR